MFGIMSRFFWKTKWKTLDQKVHFYDSSQMTHQFGTWSCVSENVFTFLEIKSYFNCSIIEPLNGLICLRTFQQYCQLWRMKIVNVFHLKVSYHMSRNIWLTSCPWLIFVNITFIFLKEEWSTKIFKILRAKCLKFENYEFLVWLKITPERNNINIFKVWFMPKWIRETYLKSSFEPIRTQY